MKKYLFCILAMALLLCSCATNKPAESVGKPETDVSSTQTQQKDDNLSSNTVTTKPETDVSSTQAQEVLSAEDKAVKAEIAKHIDTKVDFRQLKKEKIQEKEFDISFLEVKDVAGKKRVVYKNSYDDEFMYSADSGKLFYARIKSIETEKISQSVDMSFAQKIATQYATEKCNLSEYKLDYSREDNDGYVFAFSKYILGYDTDASLEIGVGLDGKIVYVRDNTDVFDGIDINITEEMINLKAQQALANYDTGEAEIKDIHIIANGGALCLKVRIAHGKEENVGTGVSDIVIPLE